MYYPKVMKLAKNKKSTGKFQENMVGFGAKRRPRGAVYL